MHNKLAFAGTALMLALGLSPLHSQSAPACPAVAIDSAQMMRDVFRLADDSMRGRLVGSSGNARARDFIAARFDALGLSLVGSGRIQPFTVAGRSRSINGANVVGVIKGSRRPDEYIVVTAHFDHIGAAGAGPCRAIGADSICNGADDNASGSAGLLALAKLFSREKPQHSLLFVAFDAEESGDVGSDAFVAASPVPLEQMLVDVNMDMVGRNVKNQLYAAGPTKYPQLRPLVEQTVGCAAMTLTIGHDGVGGDDWTGHSDQGAFHAKGVPFVYFGEEDHPDYHKAGDQAERLMPAFYAASVRSVGDFIRRFDAAPVARLKPKQ